VQWQNNQKQQLKNILMKKDNLICGQCNAQLEDIEESYIEVIDEHNGNWYQCFDCYSYHQDQFYDNAEESYADFYCRTSCSCCAGNEHQEWYDDEEE
jgi:hypothetical protein